ncbi:MAG: glutamate racemase [Clostridia bacterium]|nr:glutamate racemase [Clostridia bacterium]
MADSRAIGIFDSGLGGLTVAREVISRLPNEDVVYFGDTGRVPYGSRSRETIKKYASQDERFLLKHNVKLIIAACGTVSSVAADAAKDLPVPYFEMVTHAAKAAVSATKSGKIGVIGTAATVGSGSHKREILKLLPDAEVTACSCSLFVPLVEVGWYSADDIVVKETVKRYLTPIINAGCDTLILGCTHYPVLQSVIGEVLGDNVTLINPGIAVASAVKDFLISNGTSNENGFSGNHEFFVTDKPDSFKTLAAVLLGEKINEDKVKQVELDSL